VHFDKLTVAHVVKTYAALSCCVHEDLPDVRSLTWESYEVVLAVLFIVHAETLCWLYCLLCMQKRCVGCTVYCECRNVVLAVLFIVNAETLCWLYCLL
jgi:hypothetical protein